MPIPLIKPTPPIPDSWKRYLYDSYTNHHFCNFGPAHQRFQERIKQTLNIRHTPILCCNATLALEVVLLAADLSDCDILVPSFTFAATALAVERIGSRPIFTDSDPFSWHMCLKSARQVLTKKTKAMIVVHPLGMVVDPEPYKEFAEEHELKLIFDSAAAFGAQYPEANGTKPFADETGLCEVFSFHITKALGIGEGSAIISGDPLFLEKCRRITNFGFNDNAEVELLGTNAKMSDFQAAIGLAVLDTAADTIRVRRDLAACYLEQLTDCWYVSPQICHELSQHTFPFFPIKYHGDRELLIKTLAQHEIGFRQYYKPLHLHPRYSSKKRNKTKKFPVANVLAQKVFCLPCHNSMTLDDVKYICNLIKSLGGNDDLP